MVLRRRARTAAALREVIPLLLVKQPLPDRAPAPVIKRGEQDQLPADQAVREPEARGRDQQAHADQDRRVPQIHRQRKGLPGDPGLLPQEIKRTHATIEMDD